MTRLEIENFILNSVQTYGEYNKAGRPFCFNVKLRSLDFSFDNLWWRYKDYWENSKIPSEKQYSLGEVRKIGEMRYPLFAKDNNTDALYNRGVRQARQLLDGIDSLPNGRPIKVSFSFFGRSGGWLSIDSFGVHNEASDTYSTEVFEPGTPVETYVNGMKFVTLRQFYNLVKMVKGMVDEREAIIELMAAEFIFENHTPAIIDCGAR